MSFTQDSSYPMRLGSKVRLDFKEPCRIHDPCCRLFVNFAAGTERDRDIPPQHIFFLALISCPAPNKRRAETGRTMRKNNESASCAANPILQSRRGSPRQRRWAPKVKTGCKTCRVRHIKCDEAKPACKKCISAGKRCDGYVYNAAQKTPISKTHQVPCDALGIRHMLPNHQSPMSLCFTEIKPSRPPSNELTSATGSLVYILNVVDPAYSILSFGECLKDYPQRMEHNKVLTAASKVLTASVFSFYTGSVSSKPLVQYGKALRVLISSVGAVHCKTQIVDTMCAIGILLASHNVRGSNRREFEVLLRGLVYFLDMLGDEEFDNAFDNEVVSNLRRLVIVASIMDPTMRFNPRLYDGKKRQSGLVATVPGNVGTARCSQQWRDLIQISSYLEDPISNLDHITMTYQQLSTDLALLEKNATDVFRKVKTSRDSLLSLQYIRQEAGNSGLLTMAMALNMALRIIDPGNSALLEEAVTLVSVVLRATDRVSLFKPLSTALLGNSLCLAWVVAVNPQEKERVRKMLDGHSYIFRGTTWEGLATKFQKRFDGIRAQVRSPKSPA